MTIAQTSGAQTSGAQTSGDPTREIGPIAMLIDGKPATAASGRTTDLIDPSTGLKIGTAPAGSAPDVDRAVAAASKAFETGGWADMPARDRARIMLGLADLIEDHAEELAHLETLNAGMLPPLAGAMVSEVANYFRYYAGWCTKIHGRTTDFTAPMAGRFLGYTLRQPVGVCGFITPWNFPLSLASVKIAPALAAGCTCILKPSEETPASAVRLAELGLEAGLPPGVFNVVTGRGGEAGAAIAAHPGIAKVAFTGSTAVGKDIVRAAAGNLKKLTLELGGKSPVIVFDDADLDQAIMGAAIGIFTRSGQVCIAGSRLYVQRKSFERVVEGVARVAQGMKVGDSFAADTQIGPIISDKQLQRITGLIVSGVESGADLVTGGRQVGERGYFIEPTILANPSNDSTVIREEIFGPVLCAVPFDDVEEVYRLANDSDYGLAAAIWSRDVARVHDAARRLQAGIVWANCAFVTDASMPVAGFKQSGWGAELGREGLDSYLSSKSVYVPLG